jgi:hypothetical protein
MSLKHYIVLKRLAVLKRPAVLQHPAILRRPAALKYVTVFLFLLAVHYAPAQQAADFTLSRTLRADIADFTVDNLGNIYVLDKDNLLKKLDANGDSLAVFNDVRRYGNIWTIDVTNPLKILVFYRDFSTIVQLDRFLNIVNIIDLRNLGILQVKAVGMAYDNNAWVYDELEAKLKRIGDDGSLVDQTADFHQLFDSVPDPVSIVDQGGLVYLYDPAKGVYAFDHYGGLKVHVPLLGWMDFNVIDKSMIGRTRQKLYKYVLGTLDEQEEPLPAFCQDAIKIRIMPTSIYVLKAKGLEVYTRH